MEELINIAANELGIASVSWHQLDQMLRHKRFGFCVRVVWSLPLCCKLCFSRPLLLMDTPHVYSIVQARPRSKPWTSGSFVFCFLCPEQRAKMVCDCHNVMLTWGTVGNLLNLNYHIPGTRGIPCTTRDSNDCVPKRFSLYNLLLHVLF